MGCKGMLGTEIARQFAQNNVPFIGTDREVDITDPAALEQFVRQQKERITWIVNCSAYTAVDKAEDDSELAAKLNEDGPRNIASVAKKAGARLIHISTDYVFDGTGCVPYTEDMPMAPLGVYGVTKAAGEKAVQDVLKENFYIIRTAWLYGWDGKNFVYTMVKLMNSKDSFTVVQDQQGTPTFAGDLARAVRKFIELGDKGTPAPYGVYHCTDLGQTNWYEFAEEIRKVGTETGLITHECTVHPCTTAEYPTKAVRPAYSVLSKDKIQQALGITLPQWQESLRVFIQSPLYRKE
ncbi:MAG: dTDP-4-dehydrorhamnose reductase [Treponema sp.]